MIHLNFEKLEQQSKRFNKALDLICEIQRLIKHIDIAGSLNIETWGAKTIELSIRNTDLPIEYVCGIVAEVELALAIPDMKPSVYDSLKTIIHDGYYKQHPFEIIYAPSNVCQWVETGEIEHTTRKKLKLIC